MTSEPGLAVDADQTDGAGVVSGRHAVAVLKPPSGRSPARWLRDIRAATPAKRSMALAGVTMVGLAFVGLVVAYGLLPGFVPNPIDIFGGSGLAVCASQHFPTQMWSCPNLGYPSAYESATARPVIWLSSIFQWMGLDVVNATRLVWLVALIAAFWGTRRFFARVTPVGWLAWIGVLAYLAAPIVFAQGGYGALQIGFMLVPVYVLMDIRLVEGLNRHLPRRRLAWRVLSLVLVRTLGLLIDPYSFVVATVCIAAVWLIWATRNAGRHRWAMLAFAGITVLMSFIVAYLIYSSSVDTSTFRSEPLDFFRGGGVDLYAIIVPSASVWWASLTGLHNSVQPLQAYSDGHNLLDVYLGIPLLVTAALGAVVGSRRGRYPGARLAAVVAGLVMFALALGPSIRLADFKVVAPGARITYTMPAAAASFASPWSWVYQHIPGISLMRAVWRWELGVRLAALTLAVMGLSWWLGRSPSWRTRWIPIAVAGLILVESVTNIPIYLRQDHRALGAERAVEAEVTQPLVKLVKPDERAILYGPGGVSPGSNDLMANFICPVSKIKCYNAGGDKALGNALGTMPSLARQVIANHAKLGDPGVEKAVAKMFASGELDVLVLTNFDLNAQAASWPPSETVRSKGFDAGQKLFRGPGFSRTDTPFFTVIRPRPVS